MRKTAREIYQALSEEFVRKGIASNLFSELEELYTWASIGENAKSEYEEINELLERLRECEESLGYYADRNSWRYEEINDCDARITQEDLSVPSGWCEENGGKRARAYFKKYEDKNVR